jgi:hypothetical protein
LSSGGFKRVSCFKLAIELALSGIHHSIIGTSWAFTFKRLEKAREN